MCGGISFVTHAWQLYVIDFSREFPIILMVCDGDDEAEQTFPLSAFFNDNSQRRICVEI